MTESIRQLSGDSDRELRASAIQTWTKRALSEWRAGLIGLAFGILVLIAIRIGQRPREPVRPAIQTDSNVVAHGSEFWGSRLRVSNDGRLVKEEFNAYLGGQDGLEYQVARLFLRGHSDLAFRVVETVHDDDIRRRLLLVIVDRIRTDQIQRGFSDDQLSRLRIRTYQGFEATPAVMTGPAPADAGAPIIPDDDPPDADQQPKAPDEAVSRKEVEMLIRGNADQERLADLHAHSLDEQQKNQRTQDIAAEKRWIASVEADLARAANLARLLPSSQSRGEVMLAIANEAEPIGLSNSDSLTRALEALKGGIWERSLGGWFWSAISYCWIIFTAAFAMIFAPILRNLVGDYGRRQPPLNPFPDLLRDTLANLDLTDRKIAKLSGVRKSAVCKFLQGGAISQSAINALAKVAGLEVPQK